MHDEVIVQPPTLGKSFTGYGRVGMIDGMQTFVGEVPITAEAAVGRCWAEKIFVAPKQAATFEVRLRVTQLY